MKRRREEEEEEEETRQTSLDSPSSPFLPSHIFHYFSLTLFLSLFHFISFSFIIKSRASPTSSTTLFASFHSSLPSPSTSFLLLFLYLFYLFYLILFSFFMIKSRASPTSSTTLFASLRSSLSFDWKTPVRTSIEKN